LKKKRIPKSARLGYESGKVVADAAAVGAFLEVVNVEGDATEKPSDPCEKPTDEQNPEPFPLFRSVMV